MSPIPDVSPLVAGGLAATILAMVGALVAMAYAAYYDALARGSDTPLWWVAVSVVPVYGWLYYWWARRRLGERERSPSGRENVARTWLYAVLIAFVIGALVTPPDPITQVLYFPPLFVAALPLAYVLVYERGLDALRSQAPGA